MMSLISKKEESFMSKGVETFTKYSNKSQELKGLEEQEEQEDFDP